MWVKHDLAFLDITVFLEETSDFGLGKARVNAGDEKVRARVDCTVILRRAAIVLGWTTGKLSERSNNQKRGCTDRLST